MQLPPISYETVENPNFDPSKFIKVYTTVNSAMVSNVDEILNHMLKETQKHLEETENNLANILNTQKEGFFDLSHTLSKISSQVLTLIDISINIYKMFEAIYRHLNEMDLNSSQYIQKLEKINNEKKALFAAKKSDIKWKQTWYSTRRNKSNK